MSSFIPVLTIGIVLDSFYLLVFYSEKFSAWVWILPFAVNVNLNLSIDLVVFAGMAWFGWNWAFSLTWPAAAQMFCEKRKLLVKEEFLPHRTGLGHQYARRFIFWTPTWRLWRHDVKMLFANFWKSLVITMPSLKLIQSESLEFSGEKSLLLRFRGLCMVFIFDLRKILPVFCRKRWCQLVRLRTAVVRIDYICQNWYEVELYRKLALSKFVDRRESPRRWIKQ